MEKSNTIVMGTTHNFGSSLLGMGPGDKIRIAREKKNWSQADLGREVGISQVAIQKIEDGGGSKFMPRIALKLDLPLSEIDPSLIREPEGVGLGLAEAPNVFGRRDLPIYAAAEGGPGEIIRSVEPVDWHPRPQQLASVKEAYGLYVVGLSMVPEYRPGDIALVNPNLPIVADEVHIFYAEKEGEARATIKHLRRATSDKWLVLQHNKPRDFELSRREWQWAHRVIGKYSRQ